MKAKDWIYVAAAIAAFVLGALLFRGCPKPAQTVEVVKWRTVNLDSLKATMKPDTVLIPGKQITKIVTVPVLLSDTAKVDSLVKHFTEQVAYYRDLIKRLTPESEWGWEWGTVDVPMKTTVYSDSIKTERYFHRWRIEAEGPIRNYTYGILPICPPAPPVSKPPKLHRVGAFFGGQTASGALRPLCSGEYTYNWISVNAGYLPPVNRLSLPGEFQVGVGLNVGLK